MPVEVSPSAPLCYPTAGYGTTLTPSGTAWNNTAWTQVINSTEAAWTLTGISIDTSIGNIWFEIDIGVGGAGSEAVIATVRGFSNSAAGIPWIINLPIPLTGISSGNRVSLRMRKEGTNTNNWYAKLHYYSGSVASISTSNGLVECTPTSADGTSLTPVNVAWSNSNYAELVASMGNDSWILGLAIETAVAVEFEVDIAFGGAGAEVVKTTIKSRGGTTSGPAQFLLNTPYDYIPSGTRVAVRLRKAGSSVTAWKFTLLSQRRTGSLPVVTTKSKTWAPSAAVGASVSPSTTTWNNSSWVELSASVSGASALAGISLDPGTSGVGVEVEIGTGGAGAEVPISVLRLEQNGNGGEPTSFPVPLAVNNIANAARLAVRLRKEGTASAVWAVSAGLIAAYDGAQVVTGACKDVPAAADGIAVTPSGGVWTNGSYSQITAGIANDIWLASLAFDLSGTTDTQFEIDLATGGAGAESVVATLSGTRKTLINMIMFEFAHPIAIAANTRIAARVRQNATNTSDYHMAANYYHQEAAAAGGPFPHFIRRSNELTGGLIAMGA